MKFIALQKGIIHAIFYVCKVQGAVLVASLVQVFVGWFGLIGVVLRFIGPLAIAPNLCLIGLSLFGAATNACEKQWGIAFL